MLLTDFLTALLIGLAGAGHCFGMCGGIVGALSFNTSHDQQTPLFAIHSLYHLGRITTYSILAVLITFFFQLFSEYYQSVSYLLRTLAGSILIFMGLYLLNISFFILRIEKVGTFVWKYLSPSARGILPIKKPHHAFYAGLIWGWLPCGLVYSSLLWVASVSTSTLYSGYLMLAFGLGTIPVMLTTSLVTFNVKQLWNRLKLNTLSGCFMVIYGLWTLPIFESVFSIFHNQ